jgi:alpha-amylase
VSARISLALTLHNHQPVGNFGWVVEEVFEKAYAPMIDALERHPAVRAGLHYTGPLLEWLVAERPQFVARVRALQERGQVEILGGGLYEPVLAALPERDRLGQLGRMVDAVGEIFGRRTRGAWLAERVWEPSLPTSLAGAGYDWTILDDAHFLAAGPDEDGPWGAYVTEDQGLPIVVFGTPQALRYRIPFGRVDEVVGWLRDHATDAGDRVALMGDDGEKFGAWPTTWEHCWGRDGWVDSFFEALEANADWLATVTPSAWLDRHAPLGRVYLPTASYAEMGEWVLPPGDGRLFGSLLRQAREEGDPAARFLRGGFWRNFQVRYREINDLHKQMLRVSAKVEAMHAGRDRERALDHLHRGQSNDCYWHGLFGGIYIAHLRAATLAHLIAAEDLADGGSAAEAVARESDLDLDGRPEVLLADEGQVLTVDVVEGAGIGGWDVRAARHALAGVLRRRPEAYHEKIVAPPAPASPDAGAVASIHDEPAAPAPGLAEHLVYDRHERRSGLVRFLDPAATATTWARAEAGELGDFVEGAFGIERCEAGLLGVSRLGEVETPAGPTAVLVERVLTLGGSRLAPTLGMDLVVANRGARHVSARLGVEWATTMLGGGGNPAAWWELEGRRTGHDAACEATRVSAVAQGNDYVGIAVTSTLSPPGDAWCAPIETVSNSESGFERAYQGAGLLLSWALELGPGERASYRVEHALAVRTDKAAEESASWWPPFRPIP